MEQTYLPGSRLRSVGSPGDAGAELPAAGSVDYRQHRLLGIDVTPSLGIGTVYVSVASSPTTSMPSTKLRMSAFRSGTVPSCMVACALPRIHRCGAALGLEQGVRAVGRDGPRSIPINGAGGGLWLSLGAPMAVLGSGAGAGSAGQYAGEDNRGPGRCDSVGRLGSLVDGSGAVGAVRQAMAGLAIEPGRE